MEPLEDRWLPSTNIGGSVYVDFNNNGIRDGAERGLANNTIQLHDATGALVAQTTTDGNGQYLFTIDPRISTAPTTTEVDANFGPSKTDVTWTQSLAQFNPALGTLTEVDVINSGALTSGIQIESLDTQPSVVNGTVSGILTLQVGGMNPLQTNLSTPETASVGGFVPGGQPFTGPSSYNFGAKTASGFNSVSFTAPGDLAAFTGTGSIPVTETAQATSSASGVGNLLSLINSQASSAVRVIYHYIPSNALPPGNYTVVLVVEPPGFLPGQTTKDNFTPMPNSVGNQVIPVTLTNNSSLNNNFGELYPSSVSGYVYADSNNDGIKEPGEIGLGGVFVNLSGTTDIGTGVNITLQTGPDGYYAFGSLRPGTYTLTKESEPAGYLAGKATLGSQGGVTSGLSFTNINLPACTNGINNNFGEILPGALSGSVFADPNDDGIRESGEQGLSGVTVGLTGVTDQGTWVSLTQQTGAYGIYGFGGLRPGTYTLTKLSEPAGYFAGKTSIGTQGGTASGLSFTNVVVQQGTNGLNNNFGEVLPAGISGVVYVDANANGVRDPGELGLQGITVTLTGETDQGTPVSLTQQTGPWGIYGFGGLRPGRYTVTKATQPAGYLEGSNSLGSLGGTQAGDQFFANLKAGDNGLNYNFGELLPSALPPVIPTGVPVTPPVTPTVTPPTDTNPLSKRDFIGTAWEQFTL